MVGRSRAALLIQDHFKLPSWSFEGGRVVTHIGYRYISDVYISLPPWEGTLHKGATRTHSPVNGRFKKAKKKKEKKKKRKKTERMREAVLTFNPSPEESGDLLNPKSFLCSHKQSPLAAFSLRFRASRPSSSPSRQARGRRSRVLVVRGCRSLL